MNPNFGVTNLRNNEPSEHRTFGTTDLRNNGPSEKRAVPHLNTYVMGLRPLKIFFQCGDCFIRQNLTYKGGPRAERVNWIKLNTNLPYYITKKIHTWLCYVTTCFLFFNDVTINSFTALMTHNRFLHNAYWRHNRFLHNAYWRHNWFLDSVVTSQLIP